MPFSQIIPPSPFPTESKRLLYSSVSLLLSRIQGYRYHLSKFRMFTVTLNCIPSLQHWIHRLGPLPLPPTVPSFSSVQFSHLAVSDSLQPHEMQHTRPPCPSPTPGVHPDSHFVPYVYIKICHWSCHNAVVKRPANPEQWKRSVVFLASYVHFRMIITPFPSLTSKCPRDLVCMFAAFCMVSGVSSHCVIVHIWPNES